MKDFTDVAQQYDFLSNMRSPIYWTTPINMLKWDEGNLTKPHSVENTDNQEMREEGKWPSPRLNTVIAYPISNDQTWNPIHTDKQIDSAKYMYILTHA